MKGFISRKYHYPLKIDARLMDKIRVYARSQNRSVNSAIADIIFKFFEPIIK
jgi:hypothetical protein